MKSAIFSHAALALGAAALAGCISIDAAPPAASPADSCRAGDWRGMVGAPLAAATFPVGVRVLTPGAMVTQDYAPTRLNVLVDDKGIITGFRCG
ncbi:MAG: hypothetical protein KJS97_00645 [Alphaproteobacteria bacterium]|nr:hypothetical protein [Alphaproteobacteria bacterium]